MAADLVSDRAVPFLGERIQVAPLGRTKDTLCLAICDIGFIGELIKFAQFVLLCHRCSPSLLWERFITIDHADGQVRLSIALCHIAPGALKCLLRGLALKDHIQPNRERITTLIVCERALWVVLW